LIRPGSSGVRRPPIRIVKEAHPIKVIAV
jgi:hypothetical protein